MPVYLWATVAEARAILANADERDSRNADPQGVSHLSMAAGDCGAAGCPFGVLGSDLLRQRDHGGVGAIDEGRQKYLAFQPRRAIAAPVALSFAPGLKGVNSA